MATQTTNYKLNKPASTDLISVNPFNENFDTIDTTLKTISDGMLKFKTGTLDPTTETCPDGYFYFKLQG